jgi:autotransporter-associated beta strand protein
MRLRAKLLLAVVAGVVAGATGRAQTWLGHVSGVLENPANWSSAPNLTAGTANLTFGSSANYSLTFSSPISINSITLSNLASGYYQFSDYPSNAPFTLGAGGITIANSASLYLYSYGGLNLAAAQTWNAGSGYLYLGSALTGSSALTLTAVSPYTIFGFFSDNSGYSGAVTLAAGQLVASLDHAVGTGHLTLKAGTTVYGGEADVTLPNAVTLEPGVTFSSDYYGDNGQSLIFSGTLTGTSQTMNVTVSGAGQIRFSGGLTGPAGTSYRFDGDGTAVLSGTNAYTGGTIVNGSQVIFDGAAALPGTGLIQAANTTSYAGVASPATVAAFVAKLDPANFHGVVGVDTYLGGSSAAAQTFSANVNLSGFSDPSVRFGTATRAIYTGIFTPPTSASNYEFGGSGTLFLQNSAPVSGSLGLRASTTSGARAPFTLVMGGSAANSYTGGTTADGGAIIFDSATAAPATGSFNLAAPGYANNFGSVASYIGVTAQGPAPATIISRLGYYDAASVLGLDSHDLIANLSNPGSVESPATSTVNGLDLSALTAPIYVGSATAATLTGTIQTTNGNTDDYYFTGYNGGLLTVSSTLDGAERKVYVGLFDVGYNETTSAVYLTAANTYGGGTEFISGNLHVESPQSLGTGPLRVESSNSDYHLLQAGSDVTQLTNPIVLNNYAGLTIQAGNSSEGLSLTGNISGIGYLNFSAGGPYSLSGNNTYDGGTTIDAEDTIVNANSDSPFGISYLQIYYGTVNFSTQHPSIGALYGYSGTLSLAAGSTLTITQAANTTFAGTISGTGAKLVKSGSGSLTLNGTNTYDGGTIISQGQLVAGAGGAFGTGSVTLNGGSLGVAPDIIFSNPLSFGAGGGTLSGNGTIAAPITAGSLVVLSPGNSPGTLSFTAGLTFASAGTLVFQVQDAAGVAGTGYDLLAVSGVLAGPGTSLDVTATPGAPFIVKLFSLDSGGNAGAAANFNAAANYSWTFATAASGISGFASDKFVLDPTGFTNGLAGGNFSFTENGNSLVLNFTAVPEPSTWALLAAGLLATLLRRRRRA